MLCNAGLSVKCPNRGRRFAARYVEPDSNVMVEGLVVLWGIVVTGPRAV